MNHWKEKLWLQVFTIYLRYLIGGAFVFGGVVKVLGKRFTAVSGADAPIHSAFHFFETMYQSGLYWQFLGWGQVIAGFLLMTQRFAKLGALFFLPVIANVFVITLSYDFGYTPVITGLMLLANLYLAAWHWAQLKILVNLPPEPEKAEGFMHARVWEITGLALFLFTVYCRARADQYNIMLWFGGCLVIGVAALVYGLLKNRVPKLAESGPVAPAFRE